MAVPEVNNRTFLCQGESALIRAAHKGRTEVVAILIEREADVNLENKYVRSADWV